VSNLDKSLPNGALEIRRRIIVPSAFPDDGLCFAANRVLLLPIRRLIYVRRVVDWEHPPVFAPHIFMMLRVAATFASDVLRFATVMEITTSRVVTGFHGMRFPLIESFVTVPGYP
jgi:hypothetical protein